MKILKIFASGALLSVGFMFLMVSVAVVFEKEPSPKDKSAALGGIIVGVPATVSGGWLAFNLYRSSRRRSQNQLQATFFRLLKADHGRITPLGLSMEAGISGEAAKNYLDERAREFIANFDVDEQGNVYYCFNLGETDLLNPQVPKSSEPPIDRADDEV